MNPLLKSILGFLAAVVLTLAVLYMLSFIARMLLLTFAGILFAVALDAAVSQLQRGIRLPRAPALALTLLCLVAFLTGFVLLAGPAISEQMGGLRERIPEALGKIRSMAEGLPWAQELLARAESGDGRAMPGFDLLGGISAAFGAIFGSLLSAVIIIALGVYLSFRPGLYLHAFASLFPRSRRQRIAEVFAALGRVMRWWLLGRLITMIVMGVLTTLGLTLIGVPLAFSLGFTAGLLSFIPFVGFLLAIIPALLVAWLQEPTLALWVLGVFAVVEGLEGYLITPLVEHRTVSIPPAMVILLQLFFGGLLGILGMFLATPLGVVVIVLIQMLYIEDVLGDRVEIMGEH